MTRKAWKNSWKSEWHEKWQECIHKIYTSTIRISRNQIYAHTIITCGYVEKVTRRRSSSLDNKRRSKPFLHVIRRRLRIDNV